MKLKDSKKTTKRGVAAKEHHVAEKPDSEKPAKMAKLTNGEAKNTQEKPLASVNVAMFQYFKELTHEEDVKRMDAALHLIQELSKSKDVEKRQKELSYTLKRLVRGCGAATNISRTGFYTGLVAFLKAFDAKEVSVEQVFECMQKELHTGTNIANKEDADAVVGKILVCGALLQTDRLANSSGEILERVANTLLLAAKHRTYHASLAFAILIELIEKLTEQEFATAVWPLLQRDVVRPWPKQTLHSVHCLIMVQRKFGSLVSAKYLKSHFGHAHLLNPESYAYLYKIFWEHNNALLLTHPAFECFGAYIGSSPHLNEFWLEHVDPGLQTHNKLREIITLKIATEALNHITTEQAAKLKVSELLSDNFMRTLVEGLKGLKQKKDETLKAFYDEFFEALVESSAKLPLDVQRTAIIRRLILPPGVFSIEKYTSTRVIHQMINGLREEGVKELFELYKRIFRGTLPKDVNNASDSWLNFERLNSGYMLQHLLMHKSVQSAYEWREEQLRFLLTCGVFHVNGNGDICKKEAADSFSKEFGEQCKNMFYTSLQSKLTDMAQEQQLLSNLVQFCQGHMQGKQASKQLRIKFDEELQGYWKRMYNAVCQGKNHDDNVKAKEKTKRKKNVANDKVEMVFQILLLNMGLQLLREPEMAGPAIEDLLKCMQKAKEKQERKKEKATKSNEATEEGEEPSWIEVVVDLFLHLLSQNASALRNIVNALFPHLCGNLNLSAVHQILCMLDMKDGQNPLSSKNEESDDDEEDEEDSENEDDDQNGAASDENASVESDDVEEEEEDDEEDDEDDDDDNEEDEADDDEEVSASDKLRNAISQALIANGAAINGDNDDDMASVDLNDMTEEEGRKLDEALANAFKALKKSGGSSAQSKKSKSHRVQTTTVMHFRIRVLDLIELYLHQKPSLLITIEIMLALFDMMQHSVGDELKPLQSKVEKVLQKLTALKGFECDADLSEDNLADFMRLIVEKRAPAASFESMNKMRSKCIAFLISSLNSVTAAGDKDDMTMKGKVYDLWSEYVKEFVRSRNPSVNITLLSDLFRLRWQGIWNLAVTLVEEGITIKTRVFRRIQIYEILATLYKNNELQKINNRQTKMIFEKIEKPLNTHIKALAAPEGTTKTSSTSEESHKTSAKEFQVLVELLLHAQKANARLQLQSALASPEVSAAIQSIRKQLRLENSQVYQRYCAAFKLKVLRNSEVQTTEAIGTQNGHATDTDEGDDDGEKGVEAETIEKQAVKRKQTKELRKQKKQKKQQRMEASSRGLNGGFGFAQQTADSDNDETMTT